MKAQHSVFRFETIILRKYSANIREILRILSKSNKTRSETMLNTIEEKVLQSGVA